MLKFKKITATLLIIILTISYMPLAVLENLSISFESNAITEFWEYNYSGNNQTWTTPYTGWYRIDCYGAQGGSGAQRGDSNTGGSASGGTNGTYRASIVKIKKGTPLTIHVGGRGGNGDSSYSGQTGGSGGWNDGSKGTGSTQQGQSESKYYCAYGGGGGGSSYITVSGTKVISAQGGKGGDARRGPNGSDLYWTSGSGGAGGGETALRNATNLTWDTAQLNTTTGGARSGNGYISIRLISAIEITLTQDPTDFTNGDVTITGTAKDEKIGLPELPLSWDGGERTNINHITVTKNGIHTLNAINNDGDTEEERINITNIDKLSPTINNITQVVSSDYQQSTITVAATDPANTDYSASGIVGYALTQSKEIPTEFQAGNVFTVRENGTYYAWAKDKVGNISQIDETTQGASSILVKDLEVKIQGNITWNDQEDKYHTRKEATLNLYKSLEGGEETLVTSQNLSVGQTSYEFKTRERDDAGNIYNFRLEQTVLDGYETIYTQTDRNPKMVTINVDNNLILPEYNTEFVIEPINSPQNQLLKGVDIKIKASIEESASNRDQVGVHDGLAVIHIDPKFVLDKNSINLTFTDSTGTVKQIKDYTLRENRIITYVGKTETESITTPGTKLSLEVNGRIEEVGQYDNYITYTGKLRDYRGKNTDIDLGTVVHVENNHNIRYQIPIANIRINKIDSITEEALTDAEFILYEWDGEKYIPKETLTDDNKDGIYESQYYTWNPTTQGKYKIVEETIPEYHNREIPFSMEYELNELKEDNYTVTTDYDNLGYKISYGKRNPDDLDREKGKVENEPWKLGAQIEKIDSQTKEIIENEAEFTIYEWDNTINDYKEYMSYTKNEAVKMQRQDDKTYLTGEWLYYTKTNEGKYRIIETRAPEGYGANYQENGEKVSYDINILNAIQTKEYNGQVVENESTIKIGNNSENKLENDRVQANLTVVLMDSESKTNVAQGDATFENVKIGLYAMEDIKHSDGTTTRYNGENVLYKQDELIAEALTNEKGMAKFENLECGKYYAKILSNIEGYFEDTTKYTLEFEYEGEENKNLEKIGQIELKAKKQAFQMYKVSEADEALEGSGFSVYRIKDLSIVKEGKITRKTKTTYYLNDETAKNDERLEGKENSDGTYNIEDLIEYYYAIYYTEENKDTLPGNDKVYHPYTLSEEKYVIDYSESPEGKEITERVTDENGYLVSPELAYGEYIIIETSVPRAQEAAKSFVIKVEEDSREPQKLRFITDNDFRSRIKLYIKDSENGKTILNKETYFRIKDLGSGAYITQRGWDGKKYVQYGTDKNPYVTNEEGYLITPMQLEIGKYQIEEVKAPEGYVINGEEGSSINGEIVKNPKEKVIFEVKSNAIYYMDEYLGKYIIVVEQENDATVGEITLKTEGEALNDALKKEDKYEFIYAMKPIKGAEYSLYAREEIKEQYDESIIKYDKDELVATLVTNENGELVFTNVPQGKYYIKQTKPARGYALNKEEKEIEISYEGETVPVVFRETQTQETRQSITIEIQNVDKENNKPVPGGEYGLYTKEDIIYTDKNGETKVIPADTLLIVKEANEEGKIIITKDDIDLPVADYYIKEEEKPYGYKKDDTIIDITIVETENGTEVEVGQTQPKTRTHTKLNINFKSGEDIVEANFVIKDRETGEIIASTEDIEGVKKIQKDENGYYVEGILAGKYEIEQTNVDTSKGYVNMKNKEFEIGDTEELQNIEIEQAVSKIEVKIKDRETGEKLKAENIEIEDEEGTIIATTNGEGRVKIEETEDGYYIEKLPIGKCNISKIEKDGYKMIEDIEVEVEDKQGSKTVELSMRKLIFDIGIKTRLEGIIVNGKEMKSETEDMMKIEIKERKISTEDIRMQYSVQIQNLGEVEATIGEILDSIPKGTTYDKENSSNWEINENNVGIYKTEEILKPGATKELKMTVKWQNSKTNFGVKENIVKVQNSTNKYNYKESNETNNIDKVETIISVGTGIEQEITIVKIILIALTAGIAICMIAGIETVILKRKLNKN